MRNAGFAILAMVFLSPVVRAGLHIEIEEFRELPARWSGYLPDQRALRAAAAPKIAGMIPGPLRDLYADAALRLETAARNRPLTPDESADLGGLYIRLGRTDLALEILQPAARKNPDHFRLASNLGTTWQMAGDLEQSVLALEEAVRLAPQRWKRLEELHLRLARKRMQNRTRPETWNQPDDLFGIWFSGEVGPVPGLKAQLPDDAIALVQHLALWLPADGMLLWQLAELANIHGDVRTAANLLDGCVTELGMPSVTLRERRQRYRAAAAAADVAGSATTSTIRFASGRALVRSVDPARLPAIRPGEVNALPWPAIGETEISRRGVPTVLDYIRKLDGTRVTLTGFMSPGRSSGPDLTDFLLTEFPVGCWFCESPGPTQVISIELAEGVSTTIQRSALRVTGIFRLNRDDPERLPFRIERAHLRLAD